MMNRLVTRLQYHEHRMFCFVNQQIRHQALDFFFNIITHLGGAAASIATALCIALFAEGVWKSAGMLSCVALGLSHVPVAIIKKKYPRLRPYLVLEGTHTCKKSLKDHSFPSGHTTAIFSVTVPMMLITPWVTAILLPVASLVGMSRIYLGLHYPSDVLAGLLIGTTTALTTVAFLG